MRDDKNEMVRAKIRGARAEVWELLCHAPVRAMRRGHAELGAPFVISGPTGTTEVKPNAPPPRSWWKV